MQGTTLEKVLSCETLPSLPAVAARVIELTADDNVSLTELARTVQNDQALAAKILRTVNSSFYGLRKPCGTIRHAIIMLGLNAVKSLALGFSLVDSISRCSGDGFDHAGYWRRALHSAMAARRFAMAAQLDVQEEAFLGALLQDVGMVALHQALGSQYAEVIALTEGDHRALIRHEQRLLDVQHPDVGATLAQRWRLPEELAMAVKYHERAGAAPNEHLKLVRAVALGGLAAELLSAQEPAPVLRRLYQRAEQWFALSAGAVDQIFKDVAASAAQVAGLLDLEVGANARTADTLLKDAKRRLALLADREPPVCADEPAEEGDAELTDALTGLGNRRRFDQAVITAFELSRAGAKPFGVVLLEVDGLAELSDRYGDDVVDSVMVTVARLLRTSFVGARAAVCRTDTMRFGIVMTEGEEQPANVADLAETARARVHATPVELIAGGGAPRECCVTLSAGVCRVSPDQARALGAAARVTAAAEAALELAQKAGRNVVKVHSHTRRAA